MSDDRRLVYSTEHGSLDKPQPKKGKPSRKNRRQQAAASVIQNPHKQGVRIRRESKGRGGKTVSIVDGLPLDGPALKILLKQLKAALGSGGAIKNGVLEIQGDHREKLLSLLEKQSYKCKLAGG